MYMSLVFEVAWFDKKIASGLFFCRTSCCPDGKHRLHVLSDHLQLLTIITCTMRPDAYVSSPDYTLGPFL